MSHNAELKQAAEGAVNAGNHWGRRDSFERQLAKLATPEAVLALIAENEELGRYLCTCRDCGGEGALHTGDWHSYGHMEPPEPVMEKCGECDGTGLLGEIQDLYQVITERDQLRAEVAGLRTGYEAYERVNAELKAEVERLDKLLIDASGTLRKASSWICREVEAGTKSATHWAIRLRETADQIDTALGQGEQS